MNEVSQWDPRGSGMISLVGLEPVLSLDMRERALILEVLRLDIGHSSRWPFTVAGMNFISQRLCVDC